MVEHQLPKLNTGVRFSVPALYANPYLGRGFVILGHSLSILEAGEQDRELVRLHPPGQQREPDSEHDESGANQRRISRLSACDS